MVWQLRYLIITVGLGFELALPTFAFDEKAPPNIINSAEAVDPPGVAGVVVGLDMLQAASIKFGRGNGLRLVRLVQEDGEIGSARAEKLADAKRKLRELFFDVESDEVSQGVRFTMGEAGVYRLMHCQTPEEALRLAHDLRPAAKQSISELLVDDQEYQSFTEGEAVDRQNALPGTHRLSARLAVALGFVPKSLFED